MHFTYLIALFVLLVGFVTSPIACGEQVPKVLPKFLIDRFNTFKKNSNAVNADLGNVDIETRIIDGFDVQGVDNTPYLVSLSLSRIAYAHTCAGVIFHKEWVLTTAHCVEELREFNGDILGTAIYAGLKNRANISDAQIRYVDFASTHRQFTSVAGSDNIALLHMDVPFVFSARVQQVALPAFNEDYTDKLVASYGWGLTESDGIEYSKDLQYAFAPVQNQTTCSENLPADAPLNSRQICAAIKACYGDGGTPLVYWPIQGPAELVGLTSWAYVPCDYENRPTVYTEVSKYIDWIYQVLSAYYLLG